MWNCLWKPELDEITFNKRVNEIVDAIGIKMESKSRKREEGRWEVDILVQNPWNLMIRLWFHTSIWRGSKNGQGCKDLQQPIIVLILCVLEKCYSQLICYICSAAVKRKEKSRTRNKSISNLAFRLNIAKPGASPAMESRLKFGSSLRRLTNLSPD